MSYPGSRPLAVVAGASSGIGYELACVFAEQGYDLVTAAEDPGKAQAAAGRVMPETAAAKMHSRVSEPGSAS